jgi:nickel/cobalt exporter
MKMIPPLTTILGFLKTLKRPIIMDRCIQRRLYSSLGLSAIRLLGWILVLAVLQCWAPTVHAQNPLISKEHPERQISPASSPKYPFFAQIAAWQKRLNQKMTGLARQARETGSLRPLINLIIIAFVYGVLHAAGPGHGKAAATSYLVSRGRKLGSGIFLGNMIAFFHGLSGVLLVLAVHFVLKSGISDSLETMTRTTQLISYGLISLLGLVMFLRSLILWRQNRAFSKVERINDSDNKRKGPLIMALAVGVVPCPGVVLVMLFCLSIHLIQLGLLLALFMVLGMAFTISGIGVVGLTGKYLAINTLKKRQRLAVITQHAIETLAALMITLLGALFFAASI